MKNKINTPYLAILWKTVCEALKAYRQGKSPANGLVALYKQIKFQTVLQKIIDSPV